MKQFLNDTVTRQVKQDIINIQAGETDSYMQFMNNGMQCFSLCNSGGYSIIYDNTADRLIVAWAVRISVDNITGTLKGSWGNGYYYNNEGGNDLLTRYDIPSVVSLWLDKALELNELYANPL